ncbi:MAG: hypothetical protein WCC69_15025, partial [Pirellulales bacterium]
KPPRPGRLRRPVLAAAVALGLVAAVVAGLVVAVTTSMPAFYRDRLDDGAAAGAEQAARRLITKVVGLQAAAKRVGPWEAAITENELNAWLALDLPRNHAGLLPAGVTAPRIELADHLVRLGMRAGVGPLSAVVSCGLEIRLREANQVECTVADARIGPVPVPRGPLLHALAARLEPLGLMAEIRRGDGRSVLVVTLPAGVGPAARRCTVDALAVAPGEVLMAGETKEGR